jgi:Tfp pilus assembly protein PilX
MSGWVLVALGIVLIVVAIVLFAVAQIVLLRRQRQITAAYRDSNVE